MAPEVIDAVEIILNKLTNGLHETTRLNKRKIKDIKVDPTDLESLKEYGIDTSFLEAFDPFSPACKKANFINKTLQEASELMITINNGKFVINYSETVLYIFVNSKDLWRNTFLHCYINPCTQTVPIGTEWSFSKHILRKNMTELNTILNAYFFCIFFLELCFLFL